MPPLPGHSQVVIIGGGVVGASIAYHLTKTGIGDVVLLERKELTCGTTWHAAGLIGRMRATYNLTRLATYSAELYGHLQEETGESTGYRCKGALNIADSEDLMIELRRMVSMAKRFGLEMQPLTPEAIRERHPLINTDSLHGGVFIPAEAQADPVGVTRALAAGARKGGAVIHEQTAVESILVDGGRAVGVRTAGGEEITADVVVLAAGMWSRQLAADIGVTVPLHACEHYYIVTEPIADLPHDFPSLRDIGSRAYFKEDAGKLLVGCFEKEAIPWGEEGIPESFSFDSLPFNLEQFEPILEKAIQRLPILQDAGIQLFFCGPESFTPDDRYLIGETAEVDKLFVAAGMNSIGVQSAGGIGKVLAEWIRDGLPPCDLGDVDIARVMPFQRNRRYLRGRVRESLGALFDTHYPYRQMETSRGVRLSPLHGELEAAGACFGEAAGWERANWFAPGERSPRYEYAFGRQNWFPRCAEECEAAAQTGVLMDLSSFAKYRVCGPDACAFLNRIGANNADVAVGAIVYTPWLNARGGMEADLTITRLAEDAFLILSGVASQTRDLAWLRRHRRPDERVEIIDMTSAYANIGVFGPKVAEWLRAVGVTDLSEAAHPYGAARTVECGDALALALRLGYAGEAGFELLIPTEFAVNAYRALRAAGEEIGAMPAGFHAVDSMRMEKARRHFGDDLTSEDTPLQAGLGFTLDWDSDFIGRDALLPQKGQPVNKRLLHFSLTAGEEAPLMFGEEPIYRDGVLVGGVTSAAYGHRIKRSMALGYVHHEEGVTSEWCESGQWEIEISEVRHPATWHRRPPYDPENRVLRLVGDD